MKKLLMLFAPEVAMHPMLDKLDRGLKRHWAKRRKQQPQGIRQLRPRSK